MESQTLELIRTITFIVTAIVAIMTLIKSNYQYRLSVKQKRIELYETYRIKLNENEAINSIVDALVNDNENIRNIRKIDKFLFLGFYEDIALLMNTGLIKPEIAHYMFGYYAIICWENNLFWKDINRESHYWRVFKEFVQQMKDLEQKKINIPAKKKIQFKM